MGPDALDDGAPGDHDDGAADDEAPGDHAGAAEDEAPCDDAGALVDSIRPRNLEDETRPNSILDNVRTGSSHRFPMLLKIRTWKGSCIALCLKGTSRWMRLWRTMGPSRAPRHHGSRLLKLHAQGLSARHVQPYKYRRLNF